MATNGAALGELLWWSAQELPVWHCGAGEDRRPFPRNDLTLSILNIAGQIGNQNPVEEQPDFNQIAESLV